MSKSINSRRGGSGTNAASTLTWWKILFAASLILLVSFLVHLNYQLVNQLGRKPSAAVRGAAGPAAVVGDAPMENEPPDNDDVAAQLRLKALREEVTMMQAKVGTLKGMVNELKAQNIEDAAAAAAAGASPGSDESQNMNAPNAPPPGSAVVVAGAVNNAAPINDRGELERTTCTPDAAQRQAARMNKRFQEWWSHSACPDQVWMENIHETFDAAMKQLAGDDAAAAARSQTSSPRPYYVLDIGCNKGYTSADFYDALSPGENFNPSSLVLSIRAIAKQMNTKFDRDGGVCNDSNKALNKDRSTIREVEVHCFEPSPATFAMLENARTILGLDATGTGHGNGDPTKPGWHIHNAGLHEIAGMMSWHSACASAVGDELCTIVPDGTPGAIRIPVWTVDKFNEAHGKRERIVHMLKIDAEGLDPAVLTGSTQLLTENRAIMVMFEFNPGLSEKDPPHGMWGKRGNPRKKLLEVTSWLDSLGYDCYLDTRLVDDREKAKGVPDAPALYRITGDCLVEEPRVRGWANVVCASRRFGNAALLLRNLATLV